MQLLERRIQDQRFLELIRKALKAGYLISGNRETDIVGTPQGGSVISPILANIFLHELDVYVEQLKKAYDSKIYRPRSKVSPWKYSYQLRKAKLIDSVRCREMKKYATLSVDNKTVADHSSKRLMYVRYGDD